MECGTIPLLLYVDDMIIIGDDPVGISSLQQFLRHQFEMKDLGLPSYFLGMEISQDSSGYFLTQANYSSDLLACAGLTDCNTATTPLIFRLLVGNLVCLTVTHPDITYAVHIVGQFMTASHSPHYDTLIRILHYLKGTLFRGLHYFT
ncbi:uncharacterized protein LOC114285951 [Camellia sinensis]|uniref:uncharacterized protein LOC114285951 n=1 Tax=Camellia sinensis TaxID=4442 RepID=UPI0010362940|nr:uncharacterized protein LOC114285951 [Camellia sinensis]